MAQGAAHWRPALATGAAALLAACEPQAPERPAQAPPAAEAPRPETPPGEEPVWNFARAADGLKLTLGEPATDNVRLMFRCLAPGRVQVSYSETDEGSVGERMVLVSGQAQSPLPLQAAPTELGYGGVIVAAETTADDPALSAFHATGRLSVRRAGDPIAADAEPQEMDEVRAFFAACA